MVEEEEQILIKANKSFELNIDLQDQLCMFHYPYGYAVPLSHLSETNSFVLKKTVHVDVDIQNNYSQNALIVATPNQDLR